jgi:hypothetical protein
MKRFKDSNNKIVTAQLGLLYNIINKIRSIKPPSSLGTVQLKRATGNPDVPRIPAIKENWEQISKALKGTRQEDDINAIKASATIFGVPAVYLAKEWIQHGQNMFTGVNYLAAQLAVAGLVSLTINTLKTGIRAKAMQAGGGIYDKIKNIYKKKYEIETIEEIPSSMGSFGSPSVKTFPVDMTLKEIADALHSADNIDNNGSWIKGKFTYHFKNQSDVDEINHMLEQLLKDEELDTKISKYSPAASLILTPAFSLVYRKQSDWSQTTKPNVKVFGLNTPFKETPKPITQQDINKAQKEREEKINEYLKKRGLLSNQPSQSKTKFNKGRNK